MSFLRSFLNAAGTAGLWSLLLALLLGPLGINASFATGPLKSCGTSCPCDAEQHAEHAETASPCSDGDCEDDCGDPDCADHAGEAPCDDSCPDSCPECSCCPGLTVGLAPAVALLLQGSVTSAKMVGSPEGPATGALSGVFRPPRSLS